jgi:hypothetical protein
MTLLLTGACSGSAVTTAQPPEVAAPSPFILQFTGTYEDPQALAGSISWLRIDRDGTFEMMIQGAPASEHGTMATSNALQLPVTLELDAGALGTVTVTITDYDGVLHVTLDGQTSTLRATGAVGPSESLCDRPLRHVLGREGVHPRPRRLRPLIAPADEQSTPGLPAAPAWASTTRVSMDPRS